MTSENLADPAPLGLLGFGITTILLSIHNLGLFGLDSTIIAAAVLMGGVAQLIAGTIEFKRNSMFTATVFTFFGLFWITFAAIETGIFGSADVNTLATLFLLFLILSAVLFIGTLRGPFTLKLTFLSLVVMMLALTLNAYSGYEFLKLIGGAMGVITGAGAFYMASADILNEQYKRPVLPQ